MEPSRPRRRPRRRLKRWGIRLVVLLIVFAVGLAFGQALDDSTPPTDTRTHFNTVVPLSVETMTVTVTTAP